MRRFFCLFIGLFLASLLVACTLVVIKGDETPEELTAEEVSEVVEDAIEETTELERELDQP